MVSPEMRLKHGAVFFFLSAAWAGFPLAAEVTQITGNGSWCSPAQNGNGNTVICNGVDPGALDHLYKLLDRVDLDLKQKTDEANEWVRKYRDLDAQLETLKKQLADTGQDDALVQKAQDLLHEGKLDDALSVFDRLIASDENNVARAAQDHFNRGYMRFLRSFDIADSVSDFEKSFQYRPDNISYAVSYLSALMAMGNIPQLDRKIDNLIRELQDLAQGDPAAYEPVLAATLFFAAIISDDAESTEAEVLYSEAILLLRKLSGSNPKQFSRVLANALKHQGEFYLQSKRYSEAEKPLKEAVGIFRTIDNEDRGDFFTALTQQDASVAYLKFLGTFDSDSYSEQLIDTLGSLADLYSDTSRLPEAISIAKDITDAERGMLTSGKLQDRSYLADGLYALGSLNQRAKRFSDAEAAYKEAIDIDREMFKMDSNQYRYDLEEGLKQLTSLYREMNRDKDAEAVEGEERVLKSNTKKH